MGLEDFLRTADHHEPDNKLLKTVKVGTSGLKCPKLFADHWDEIEKTKLSYVKILATKVDDDLAIGKSKFGSVPILPVGYAYPKDEAGEYLRLLCQLNFSEIPKLEGFPSTGYLQFYVGTGELYGLDFDDQQSQKNFRILYFTEDEVENHQTDFAFLEKSLKDGETVVEDTHSLEFVSAEDYVGMGDVRYANTIETLVEKNYPDEDPDEVATLAMNFFRPEGHKIGGYACFTQEDPRMNDEKIKKFILLFQMDSDQHFMWGDAGVGNFFVAPEDLEKLDFSKVVYNWDCC